MGWVRDKGLWCFGLRPLGAGMAETFMSLRSVREQILYLLSSNEHLALEGEVLTANPDVLNE